MALQKITEEVKEVEIMWQNQCSLSLEPGGIKYLLHIKVHTKAMFVDVILQ